MKIILALLFLCSSCCLAFAELPPSVYEAQQHSAPEYLHLHVVDVSVSPSPSVSSVRVLAIVNKVMRTASKVKMGDTLQICYTVPSPPVRCGPREIPILQANVDSIAYLHQPAGEDFYAPAAGAMSFQDF